MEPEKYRNLSDNNHLLKDEEIARRINEGRESHLFEILYKRYYKKVVNKCFSLLKEKSLAEEAAKDILSKAFEKLDKYKGSATFSSWLYSITYNHCIDYLRLKKRLHYPDWNKKNDIPEIGEEPYEEIQENSFVNLTRILELIHPEEKALLMMRYEYNLPFKQIAGSLRISESAAKMRIKRAKARVLYHFKNFENDARY